jgi:hypothetical protein
MTKLAQLLSEGFSVNFTAIDRKRTHIRVMNPDTHTHFTRQIETVNLVRDIDMLMDAAKFEMELAEAKQLQEENKVLKSRGE